MIAQFSMYPTDSEHLSQDLKDITKLLDKKKLAYQMNPIGTCIQGDWEGVLAAIKQCHKLMTSRHNRVVTTIIIDDDQASEHSLSGAVESVEDQLFEEDAPN